MTFRDPSETAPARVHRLKTAIQARATAKADCVDAAPPIEPNPLAAEWRTTRNSVPLDRERSLQEIGDDMAEDLERMQELLASALRELETEREAVADRDRKIRELEEALAECVADMAGESTGAEKLPKCTSCGTKADDLGYDSAGEVLLCQSCIAGKRANPLHVEWEASRDVLAFEPLRSIAEEMFRALEAAGRARIAIDNVRDLADLKTRADRLAALCKEAGL